MPRKLFAFVIYSFEKGSTSTRLELYGLILKESYNLELKNSQKIN